MNASERYALDARAENYGWTTLDQPPPALRVGSGEPAGDETTVLGLPIGQTPPNILNRVNAFLSAADLLLAPFGVHDGKAFLSVLGRDGAPGSAGEALRTLAEAPDDLPPRVTAAVRSFLEGGGPRSHEISPPEVLASVKSPFSVKSSFANVGRSAVRVVLSPPVAPQGSAGGSRRVVVASPDTGIANHPWLAEGTWSDAERDVGWVPPDGSSLPSPGERNATPADGSTDAFAGHGTFVAGLIRQLAPSAHILSLHTMSGDGEQPGERVLGGLEWIRDRVATGEADAFVDVVCLACGYYEASPSADGHTARLRSVLGALGDLGVQVVVAAGNDDTESPTFPAAFTQLAADGTLPRTPLVAVGALNPDGSRTDFSNHGDWVTDWRPGVALVSTLPISFGQHSARTETGSFDPANLVGGFAQWSGSSFAAAVLAGMLASTLATTAVADVHERTRAARAALGIAT